jgi:hypothetical protein
MSHVIKKSFSFIAYGTMLRKVKKKTLKNNFVYDCPSQFTIEFCFSWSASKCALDLKMKVVSVIDLHN